MSSEQISQADSQDQSSLKLAERTSNNRGKYFYLLLAIGGIGLIFLLARPILMTSADDTPAETTARVLPVETIEVQPVDTYQVSRTYTGQIAAVRTSDLGFPRSGEIEQIYVEEGDRVNQRQPLAKLDTRNLQTQRQQLLAEKAGASAQLSQLQTGARVEDIDAAQAAVQDIEQQLKLQSQQRQRREFLYAQGAIAQEELDEFSFGEEALKARLDQAGSNLAELKNGTRPEQVTAQEAILQQLEARIADLDVNLDQSILKAPFAGIVAQRDLDEGTVANAGQSVIRLMENATPQARVGMPSRVANELIVGSTQTLKLGSQTYKAKVRSILPEVNANTRTQVVVFDLDASAISEVNPGKTVRLELAQDLNSGGYWVPTEALTQGIRGLWTCYGITTAEDENNYLVKQHSVEIIHQSGDRVLVRGTLQAGDQIVASGVHRLVPGQRVKVGSRE